MKSDIGFGWTLLDLFLARLRQLDLRGFDCVVGILRGGAPSAIVASHALDLPVYWVEAKGYNEDNTKRKVVDINVLFSKLPRRYGKSRVLLCDDIWDTGDTMTGVVALLSDDYNAECRSIVLVTKDKHIPADFISAVDKQAWVTFPWEN